MPARLNIAKRRGKARVKVMEKREVTQEMLKQLDTDDLDVTVALIQALIPCGLEAVEERLQAEVEKLAGRRYQHGKENLRWSRQPGSIYLRDQKIPIMVPRVRNKAHNKEVALRTYQKFQKPYLSDRQTMLKLLNGISTRKYKESAELVPEVFGLSPSNLSRRFKQNTQEMLRSLKTRSLFSHDFVCVFIDGKRYAEDGILIVLGVTIDGRKFILDVEHSVSESKVVITQLLDGLIERGLRFEEGLLFVVDGSKGLLKAIRNRFGEYAFIQRCLWHKGENVRGYLSLSQEQICKRRLKEAYEKVTYQEAKACLEALHRELVNFNQSAANSLLEGMEETLTLHSLELPSELCRSLNTTNNIESIMSQLGQYTDKVDRWHNSSQILRWTAAGLLEIEPHLRKINGYKHLGILRLRMKEKIKKRQEEIYGTIQSGHVEFEQPQKVDKSSTSYREEILEVAKV